MAKERDSLFGDEVVKPSNGNGKAKKADLATETSYKEVPSKDAIAKIEEEFEQKTQLVEWFDQHFYKYDNGTDTPDYFPSVTTILNAVPKPYLVKWIGEVGWEAAQKKLREAGDAGSRVHYACEILGKGGRVIYNPFHRPIFSEKQIHEFSEQYDGKIAVLWDQFEYLMCYRYFQWLRVVQPLHLETEQQVFSLRHKFAGTMDILCELEAGVYEGIAGSKPLEIPEGGWYIFDIKTSNAIDDNYFIQVSAYAKAVEEIKWIDIKGAGVIHLKAQTRSGIEGLTTKMIFRDEMKERFDHFLKIYDVWKISPTADKPKLIEMPAVLEFGFENE